MYHDAKVPLEYMPCGSGYTGPRCNHSLIASSLILLFSNFCSLVTRCNHSHCPFYSLLSLTSIVFSSLVAVLRRKFKGQPDHVVNFFWLMAEEIRGYMAELGYTNMNDMIGAAGDVLEVDPDKLNYKSKGLDLSPILLPGTRHYLLLLPFLFSNTSLVAYPLLSSFSVCLLFSQSLSSLVFSPLVFSQAVT